MTQTLVICMVWYGWRSVLGCVTQWALVPGDADANPSDPTGSDAIPSSKPLKSLGKFRQQEEEAVGMLGLFSLPDALLWLLPEWCGRGIKKPLKQQEEGVGGEAF